jgi:tetratricopeptide (TPR) repeat protein
MRLLWILHASSIPPMYHSHKMPLRFIMFDTMMKIVLITFAVVSSLFICPCAFSQTPAQYMRMGDLAVENGKWDEAFSFYQQGYEIDSINFDLTIKYADAARNIKYYQLAEHLYAKTYYKDNGMLNPDGLYWLAQMQKLNGKYEDAQRNYKTYLKKFKSKGTRAYVKRAEQEVKSALWAMDYKDKDTGEMVNRLDELINSDYSETSPFLRNDTLFFSSSKPLIDGVKWTTHFRVNEDSNIELIKVKGFSGDISNLSITSEQVAFFSSVINGETKIFSARYLSGELTDINEVKEINAEGSINSMPFYYENNNDPVLFFVSDRDGGEGGLDIWYARRNKKSASFPPSFVKPKTLGKVVNSEGDELTPFAFENTFYFSSDFHNGFGGQDIFKCEMNGLSVSNRSNLGLPINSSANDFYFITNSKEGYLSSNREGSNTTSTATCCNDLYRVIYPVVEDTIPLADNKYKSLKELNDVLPVTLYFHNDEPNPRSTDTTTTVSYGDAYDSYMALQPIYLKENTKGLSGQKREDAETITTDFFDLKVKKGRTDLDMFSELLLKELEQGNSIHLSVRGFASPRARTDYNLNLTKRRTKSLVNFLERDSSGIFLPYIQNTSPNGARLTFELLPFGEYKADKSVSDDLTDEKNSIYARAAALERKIEIVSATILAPEPSLSDAAIRLHQFGKIKSSDTLCHTFTLHNPAKETMVIDSMHTSCGCTEPVLDKYIVPAGESAFLTVGFHPQGQHGPQRKMVVVFIAGHPPRQYFIEAEVE